MNSYMVSDAESQILNELVILCKVYQMGKIYNYFESIVIPSNVIAATELIIIFSLKNNLTTDYGFDCLFENTFGSEAQFRSACDITCLLTQFSSLFQPIPYDVLQDIGMYLTWDRRNESGRAYPILKRYLKV